VLFEPDPRIKDKQRYCQRDECQTKRQRLNEKDWRIRNPDCVAYQQEQSRKWLKARPCYSQERRHDHPELATKNRENTRLRMQKMRRMFDKSKSIAFAKPYLYNKKEISLLSYSAG
jgi:hypothetical protein